MVIVIASYSDGPGHVAFPFVHLHFSFQKIEFQRSFSKNQYLSISSSIFLVNGTELEPRVRIRKCKGGKKVCLDLNLL